MSDDAKVVPMVPPWMRSRLGCVLNDEQFLTVEWPEQVPIIAPWLFFGSYHLIYGDAGVGKTYFILSLVHSMLTGESIGSWTPENLTGILYVDGEMHGQDMRERLKAFRRGSKAKLGYLKIMSSYYLAMQDEKAIDITDPEWQATIILYLQENPDVRVVVLDNLGCLAPNMDQNDQREWSTLCDWILKLKRLNCAVILVHHPNKSGGQRGTGARNDAADTVIHLRDNKSSSASVDCKITFDKARGLMGEKREGFNFCLIVEDPDGTPVIRWQTSEKGCPKDGSKKSQILHLLEHGTSQADIVAMGYDKAQVSKLKKELDANG